MERAFTKDRILALYLNEIYLGRGSHGVAAASLNYFDKALGQLTLAEMAYLAALPKALNNYHPDSQFTGRNRAAKLGVGRNVAKWLCWRRRGGCCQTGTAGDEATDRL